MSEPRNTVKVQITFDYDCGECGGDEVNEKLDRFEYFMQTIIDERFDDAKNIKVKEIY